MFREDEFLLKEIDYQALGFKAGIEIHRRLKGKKLFCRCNGNLNEVEDAKEVLRIRRVLSLSKSEIEEIDKAALEEVKKGRYYEYVFYDKGCCLIDADEEPPLLPEKETISRALKTCLLLKCKIPPEIIFMRKIVVDGSNTTGFQRTGIIGYKGKIETSKGDVGIETVCLEEESAQIISQDESKVIYDLRRLGIPLIEISTSPDLKDAEHVKETAKKIGDLLKSTGYYQRGLGSIRQDINISINKGCRVEIKGVQDIDMLHEIVKKEVMRQYALIKLREKLRNYNLRITDVINVSEYFKDSKSNLFKGKEVYVFAIKDMKGLFRIKLTPTRTLGNEIAGYVKVRTKSRGFIHSDEDLGRYHIKDEAEKIITQKYSPQDLIIFVIGSKEIAEDVREEIKRFFVSLINDGLNNETRKVLDSGDTTYLRPLPGSARMYPETDVPPILIDDDFIEELKRDLPKSLDEIKEELRARELNEEIVSQLLESKYFDIYIENKEFFETKTKEKINVLLNVVRDVERKEKIDVLKNPSFALICIEHYTNNRISKDAFLYVLAKSYKDQNHPDAIIEKENLWKISEEKIEKEIVGMKDARLSEIIAHLKNKYGMRVDAKDIAKIYNKVKNNG